MCTACRRIRPRTELYRLVRPTGGTSIVLNPQGRISGKGFYICRDAECLEKLKKDKRLRRNFSTKLDPETLQWLSSQAERSTDKPAETASCEEET